MKVNKLKSYMAARGVTQKVLASVIDVNESTMTAYLHENDTRTMDIDQARAVCDFLKIESLEERADIFLS